MGKNIKVPYEVLEEAKKTMSGEGRDKLDKALLDKQIAEKGVIGRTKELLKSPLGVGAAVAAASAVLPVSTPVIAGLKLAISNPVTTAAVVGGAAVVDHATGLGKRYERAQINRRLKKSGPKEKPKSQAA